MDWYDKRWVYYLLKTRPGFDNQTYQVCIVVENEAGYRPSGGHDRQPWYWNEEICKEENRKRGYTEEDVMKIVASSLRAGK